MTVLLKLCSNLNIGHRIHERNTISMEMLPVRLVEETHLAKLCPAKLPLHKSFPAIQEEAFQKAMDVSYKRGSPKNKYSNDDK